MSIAEPSISLKCKFCNSTDVIRYGRLKNNQRWLCKSCQHSFIDNNALPYMKVDINIVRSVIIQYFEGRSLSLISKDLVKHHNLYLSDATFIKWIIDFTQMEESNINNLRFKGVSPKMGTTWIFFENNINIFNAKYCLIDVIDQITGFLVDTICVDNAKLNNNTVKIKNTLDKDAVKPEKIIILGSQTIFDDSDSFDTLRQTNIELIIPAKEERAKLMKSIGSAFKTREYLLSKLKKESHMKTILNGWRIHYNYIRAHEFLGGVDMPPAMKPFNFDPPPEINIDDNILHH